LPLVFLFKLLVWLDFFVPLCCRIKLKTPIGTLAAEKSSYSPVLLSVLEHEGYFGPVCAAGFQIRNENRGKEFDVNLDLRQPLRRIDAVQPFFNASRLKD